MKSGVKRKKYNFYFNYFGIQNFCSNFIILLFSILCIYAIIKQLQKHLLINKIHKNCFSDTSLQCIKLNA